MIGLVTYAKQPDLTADDRPLLASLGALGLRARAVRWDDSAIEWADYQALVLRSTWDYHLRVDEFEEWLRRIEAARVPMWNSVACVRWNMHKRYLRDLRDAGMVIPRTRWLEKGSDVPLGAVMEEEGWPRAIVKPAISASATDTWLVAAHDHVDAARVAKLLRRADVLVQEVVPEVARHGEWSLMFFAGAFSHGTIKKPRDGDFRVQQELGGSAEPAQPSQDIVAAAARIAEHIPAPWLYARIDGVQTTRGFMLMEVECIEPVLFFSHSTGSHARFAAAVQGALAMHPDSR